MKIALIGAFNLADGYLGAANALKRLGHEVIFVPAYKFKSEASQKHVAALVTELKGINADVNLWWRAETLSGIEFIRVRKTIKGKFAMYSWDDPFQWEKHPEMPVKAKLLDAAFTCCQGSIQSYKENGCENAFYCPPGFDPKIHKPEKDEKYICDISIVCTNLYTTNDLTSFKHLSRKVLLDNIIEGLPDLDLRIYGPEEFKNYYPNNYKGWIPFDESRKVFHNSKINICTHIRPDGFMYINERVTQILGSKGLLFLDHVNGIEKVLDVDKECVIMNTVSKEAFLDQISNILKNNDDYNSVRENGHKKGLGKLTWDNWAKTISDNI